MKLIIKNTLTNEYQLIDKDQYNAFMSFKYQVDEKTYIRVLSELIKKLNERLNKFCPVENIKSHEKYCIECFHRDINKMKLKSIAKNQTELTYTSLYHEVTFLFSYETPVCQFVKNTKTGTTILFKTDKKFSQTTTRHINQFIDRYPAKKIETIKQKHIETMKDFYFDK
jgi:hypothetical protein